MAGHSKFKNIQYRKGAQDARRSRIFSRLAREIAVAARMGGPDPAANARLRLAVANARGENMPRDSIARAIGRSQESGGADWQEARYEGFGPGGVGVIVETLTDNRNRTAGAVRSAFSKAGGALAETGAVAFMFERMGEMALAPDAGAPDDIFAVAADAGAEDLDVEDDAVRVWCAADDLHRVARALEAKFGELAAERLVWKPKTEVAVAGDTAQSTLRLLAALEDNDDVQGVYANCDVDDAALAAFAEG